SRLPKMAAAAVGASGRSPWSEATPRKAGSASRVCPGSGADVSRETSLIWGPRGCSCRQDDDASLRLLTFGLAAQPGGSDGVMNDLSLERSHRVEAGRLPGAPDLLGRRATKFTEHRPAAGAVA